MRRKNRTAARGSGGVAVFVKNWLMQTKGSTEYLKTLANVLYYSLKPIRQSNLIIIFTYIPTENSPVYTHEDNGIILSNENIVENFITPSRCRPGRMEEAS